MRPETAPRALEAVLTSMPPIPTESILKRDHSQHVYTLANVLAERGYERLFMTGGHGTFDGVYRFMSQMDSTTSSNSRISTRSGFRECVGRLRRRPVRHALREFDRLHETGRPFFATVLTVSNHRPYTFPQGRIPEDYPDRDTAVKYADWALGQFFRKTRRTRLLREHDVRRDGGPRGARFMEASFSR